MLAAPAGFAAIAALQIAPAQAGCTSANTTTTCNTANPNPWTTTIGNGSSTASGAAVTLQPGAQISAGNANAISLGDNATITLGDNTVVRNNATSGSGVNGNGLWNAGKNTIEFGSNGHLTVAATATVQSQGTSNNAEAINVMGVGNVVTNYGTITSRSGAAIWFEDKTTGGSNTIDNFGTISTSLGANANVIGNNQNGNVNFINETGAMVSGSLSFAGGNDTLKLLPGSVITGGFNGGGGTNTLELDGTAGSSDTLAGNISNFQVLDKVGAGMWTLSGAIGNNGGNAALSVEVENGTLALTGDNTNFRGSILVDAAGVLEARAQSLPPSVTDNGLVRFVQDTGGTYTGVISGTGGVEKTLGATLTLTGANTYSGGTTIDLGEIVISSDANLGAASGGLTLNGGRLGTATDVTLARTTTLAPNGGTFDTQAGTLTDNSLVTGAGALTKIGAGTLVLGGNNTYTGTTIIDQGIVQVAADANLGDPASTLDFNGGTLATTGSFSSARNVLIEAGGGTLQTAVGTTLTETGTFTGAGMLTKTGAGTLALTGTNTQAGGTSINGGVMIVTNDAQLGASSAPLQFDGGTLVAGAGLATRPTVINAGGATVRLDGNPLDTNEYLEVTGPVSGTGGLTKTGTGTLIYSGDNSYTGPTTIAGGFFYLNGNSAAQTGTIMAESGTRLGGTGVIGGDVIIQDGATLGPGSRPLTAATLTINGNLNLSSNSILLYNLVEANTAGGALNDLTVVHGNLTLDGMINILDQGQTFGPGVYRVINYDGTLTNNGLTVGDLISPTLADEGALTGFSVQTAIAGQVNLINTTGVMLNYWDGDIGPKNNGVIDGGDGIWRVAQPASTSNWTGPDGTINAPWADGQFAIFAGAPGTVQVDDTMHPDDSGGTVNVSGMQFATSDYIVQGDALNLVAGADGTSTIRVGDGTASAASMTTTIMSVLSGTTMLEKTDLGTLILGGVNTYTGGTKIVGGAIEIAVDDNLGAAGTGVILDGGTLATTADIATPRAVTLNARGGTFQTGPSTTLELDSAVTGSGSLTKTDDGTLLLTAVNTYSGGTIVSGGTLQIGNGGTTGSIIGDVANNAALTFNRSDTITFAGNVSGTGQLIQAGTGTLILTGDSTHSGGTLISSGALQIGDGGVDGSIAGDVTDNGALIFNRSDTVTFGGAISGAGTVMHSGSGTTLLTGNNSYAGPTNVNAGALFIDGDQTSATGLATAASGASLGGSGIIGGDVIIEDGGTLRPGGKPLAAATLTINGSLALNSGSTLLYNEVEANVAGGPLNDLTVVHGNLTLDGTINILDQGQTFAPGIYRIINYDGMLTNNGLEIGIFTPDGVTGTPISGFVVQTSIPGQVNLVNTSGLNLNYWDGDAGPKNNGTINGGDGIWRVAQPASTSNWTGPDGAINAPWAAGQFAIFTGAPGTVQVDDTVHLDGSGGTVNVSGMQFMTGGYVIQGDALQLVGGTPNIHVGDGTTQGSGITATIDAVLSGGTGITKSDLGTLILNGANTFTGGVHITGGVVQISSDQNLGGPDGPLTFDTGTLRTTADIDMTRPVSAHSDVAVFETLDGTTLTVESGITGSGTLDKTGGGTLLLAADNSYLGGTMIDAGTLQLGNGGMTGSVVGDVTDNALLVFNRSDDITYGGVLSGIGAVTKNATNTLTLTGENTFTGTTTIAAGTLRLGDGGTTGSVGGEIVDNGTLVVDHSDTVTINGLISGSGDFVQAGTGITIMAATGDGHGNSYSGRTIIEQGTLQIGTGGTTGGLENSTEIINNGVYISDIHATFSWSGSVSGTGSVIIDQGAGNTLTVLGANTFTGGSTIASGIVQIGDGGTTGTLLGDIVNFGTLIVDHSDDLILSNILSGTGNAIKEGPDTIVLVGDSTYTGGTTIESGTLVLGNGGTTGSILGAIVDNAALAFNRSDSLLMNGAISGTGSLTQAGSGTVVLGGENTYTGGTTVSTGTLQVGNGNASGSIVGDVLDNAILVFNRLDTYTYSGTVSGSGQLVQAGPGTLILTANNTYAGGTAIEEGTLQISSDTNLGAADGVLNIGGAALATTSDVTMARQTVLEELGGTFDVADGTTLTQNGMIDGAGGLTKTGGGLMILNGAGSYSGPTDVQTGTLFVNGDQTLAAGPTTVESGATLGGTGIVGGDVDVADGATLAPGDDPGTFTINGNLTLHPGSVLAYEFGAPNVVGGALNDHTVVGGDLVLDGTIDVTVPSGGSFDPGIYRIFTYAGALTDNGLAIGTIPSGDYFVQTSIANEVNLVNATGITLNFWDGAAGPKNDGIIQGGTGTWQNTAGNDNWTDAAGTINAPFTDAAFAIFQGTGDTVHVDDSLGPVTVSGLQFASDGYLVTGDQIALVDSNGNPGVSIIRVGDGASDGASYTATIEAVLAGNTTLRKTDLGTLVLTSDNTYSGGIAIDGGTIEIASDANLGAAGTLLALDTGTLATTTGIATARPVSLNAGGGTFDVADSTTLELDGTISGTGSLTKAGSGTIIFTATNTYSGGTTIEGGTLQLGNGGTGGSIVGDGVDNSALVIDRSDTLTFGGTISGTGTLEQSGTGTTVLTAANSYAGPTTVASGALYINGDQSTATGTTTVAGGATLGGTGTLGGDVTIAADATLAPGGNSGVPGTLTIKGNLALDPHASLVYSFGQAGVPGGSLNDLTIVDGNLTLAGTLSVVTSPGGTFGPGIYRVIDYDGTLTDNGLILGSVPAGDAFFVQTAIPGQVNLINATGLTLTYWDGATGPKNDGVIQGGDGIWQASAGNNNWTDVAGAINAPWTNNGFAIFTAQPGTVRVDDSLGIVTTSGMQFVSDGYAITGDAITLAGSSAIIRVGDGSSNGASTVATIDAVLSGSSTLEKTDLGTLILTAANTYTGGTAIGGGTLQIASDANLGAAGTALSFDTGILATTAAITTARPITLDAGGGTIDTASSTTLQSDGVIAGTGSLAKSGAGTLLLAGNNTYGGGTTISAGTLQLGSGGTTGSITGDVTDNGTLAFDRSDTLTFGGTIGGNGAVVQAGTGTTILTAGNNYAGGTAVNSGTLVIGDAAHVAAAIGGGPATVASGATFGGYGSAGGSVDNNGTLAVADAILNGEGQGSFAVAGLLTNAGTVRLSGTGVGNRLVVGSYDGQNGQIAMTAVLNGDGSPSDQLAINGGTAGGHSVITVANLGGQGGATPGNGILLVDAVAGATTSDDAFALGERVIAGPYEYTLFRGARDDSAPQSWYLRSELTNPPVPPPTTPPAPPVTPDYRPEVSLDTALPSMALNYGIAVVGSLHKRVGEEEQLVGNDGEVVAPSGAWIRFIADDGQWDAEQGGIYRNGPSFRDDTLAVQGGVDLYRSQRDGARDFAGFTGSLGHVRGNVEHFDGTVAGTDRFEALSFGAYWTHFAAEGWYVDGLVQGLRYNAKTVSSFDVSLHTLGSGVTISAEGGYPFALDDKWSLEPEAQIIYQNLGFDDARDIAAQVRFRDVDSLSGRFGARGKRTWMMDNGRPVTTWFQADLWNEFVSNAMTSFSSDTGFLPFRSDLRGAWGEVGAGVSAAVADNFSVYATVGYQKGFDGGVRTFSGSVGVRFNK